MGCLNVRIDRVGAAGATVQRTSEVLTAGCARITNPLSASVSVICTINEVPRPKSCFSQGYWIDEAPWLDTEGWKDIP